MPTKAVFLVTHNIEEAVLLADRIVVLGRNPGHIRTDFRVSLPQPRDRKSEGFTQLVDYIYKVLTQPDAVPDEAPDHQHPSARPRDQRQMKYQMLPHARPGGIAGLLELVLDKGAATICIVWPTTWPSKSTTCCRLWTPRNCWVSSKWKKAMR